MACSVQGTYPFPGRKDQPRTGWKCRQVRLIFFGVIIMRTLQIIVRYQATIMDKSPWDSQNVTSILCVSQFLSQKAVLYFYVPSPLLTQYNVERSKKLCLDGFNTVCGVGGGVGTYSVSSAQIQFRVCYKAFELYNCPKTFVHD